MTPLRLLIPLVCYWTIAIVVPAMNGAHTRDGFIEHALTTVVVSSIIALCVGAAASVVRKPVVHTSKDTLE